MSTHIVGVRNFDKKFKKMVAVKLACEKAGIGYPQEVTDYFRFPEESVEYLESEMREVSIDQTITRLDEDGSEVWEVELSRLPKDVKAIRFKNSY